MMTSTIFMIFLCTWSPDNPCYTMEPAHAEHEMVFASRGACLTELEKRLALMPAGNRAIHRCMGKTVPVWEEVVPAAAPAPVAVQPPAPPLPLTGKMIFGGGHR
jgi:hypothetical protein